MTLWPWYTDAFGYGVTAKLDGVQILELKSFSEADTSFDAVDGFVDEASPQERSAAESDMEEAKAPGDF